VSSEVAEQQAAELKALRYMTRARAEIAKLDAQVLALPPGERAKLARLFALHTQVAALTEQEVAFKAGCKGHMAKLQVCSAWQAQMACAMVTIRRTSLRSPMSTPSRQRRLR
jgi:hypothetical protein